MYEDIGRIPIISISGYKNVSEYFSDLPLPQSYPTSRKLTDSKLPASPIELKDSSLSVDLIKALTSTNPTPRLNSCQSSHSNRNLSDDALPKGFRELYQKDPTSFHANSTFEFLFDNKNTLRPENSLNISQLDDSLNINESFEEKDKIYNVVCTQPLKISIKKSQLTNNQESVHGKVKKKRKSKADIKTALRPPGNSDVNIKEQNDVSLFNQRLNPDNSELKMKEQNDLGLFNQQLVSEIRSDLPSLLVPETTKINQKTTNNNNNNPLDTSLNKILSGPIFLPRNMSQGQQSEKENFRSIFDEEPMNEQFSGSTSEHHSTGLIHSDTQSVGILPSIEDHISGKSPASFHSNYSLNTNGVTTPAPPNSNSINPSNNQLSCYPDTLANSTIPSISTELPMHSVTFNSDHKEPSNVPTGLSAYLPPGTTQVSAYSPSNSSSSQNNSGSNSDKDPDDTNHSQKPKSRSVNESDNQEEILEDFPKDFPQTFSDTSSNTENDCSPKKRGRPIKNNGKKGKSKGKSRTNNNKDLGNKNKSKQNAEKKGGRKRRSELEDLMTWQIKDTTNKHENDNDSSFVKDIVERVKIRRQKQQNPSHSPSVQSTREEGKSKYQKSTKIYSDDSSQDLSDNSSSCIPSRKNKSSNSFKGIKSSFPTIGLQSSCSLSSSSDLSQSHTDKKCAKSFKKSLTSKYSDKNSNYMKSKAHKKSDTKPVLSSELSDFSQNNSPSRLNSNKPKIYKSTSSLSSHDEALTKFLNCKKDKKRCHTPDTLPFTQSDSELDIDLFSKSPTKTEKKSNSNSKKKKKKRSLIYSNSSSSSNDEISNNYKSPPLCHTKEKNTPQCSSKKSKAKSHNPNHSGNSLNNNLTRNSSMESIHDYSNRFSTSTSEAEKRRKCKELSATASTLSSFHDLLQDILKRVEDIDLIELSQKLSIIDTKNERVVKKHNSDDDLDSDLEKDSAYKLPKCTNILPEEINLLEIQTRQIRVAPGSISSIPTGWLVRFLTLLMLHMRSAALAPPRFPSSHVVKEVHKAMKKSSRHSEMDNPWINAFWSHSQTSSMMTGISSAVIALNIIDAPDIPRSYLIEDLIETIAVLSHKVLLNVLFLSPNSALDFSSSSQNSKNTHHLVTFLGKSLASIMTGMSSLIRLQSGKFADNIVFRLTELGLAVPIHFITYPNSAFAKYSMNNSPNKSSMPWQTSLNSASISLIGSIYAQYEGHRKLISEEIFSTILPSYHSISMKNQSESIVSSKKTAKNYCLLIANQPKFIYMHPLTSLLMSIIQSLIQAPSNYSAFHWFSGQQMTVCICQSCQASNSSLLNQSRATDKATTTTTMSNSSLCSSIAGKRTNQGSHIPNLCYPPSEADLSKINKEESSIVNSFQQTTLKHASYLLFSLLKKLTTNNESDAKALLDVVMNDLFSIMEKASLEWPVSHTLICALGTSLIQLMVNLGGSREKSGNENISSSRLLCLETLGILVNHFMELKQNSKDVTSTTCQNNVQLINSLISTCSYLTSPLNELDNNYSETRNKEIYPQLLSLRMEHSDGLNFFSRRYHVASLLSEINRNNPELLVLLAGSQDLNNSQENPVLFTLKRQLIGEINSTHHSVTGILPWYSGKRILPIPAGHSSINNLNIGASPITNASYDSLESGHRFICLNSNQSKGNNANLFYCVHTGFGLSSASRQHATYNALQGAENLLRLRPFVPSANILYSYICKALSDSSVQIRSKALKIMSSLIEIQPKILLNQNPFDDSSNSKEVDLNKIIKNRLMDQSICVREATVDLLSRLIIFKIKENDKEFTPILNEYLPLLSNRVLDKGLSVRKRAIKCFREIILHHHDTFMTNSSFHSKLSINNEQIYDICAKLIRRLNDEEVIKKTVIEIFHCLWFTPSSIQIKNSSPNSKFTSKSQLTLFKIQSLSKTILALKSSSSDLITELFKNLMDTGAIVNGQNHFICSCQEIIEEILRLLEEYMTQAEGNDRLKLEKKNQIGGFLSILNYIFSLDLSQNVITTFSLAGLPIYRYLTRLFHIILFGIDRDTQHSTQIHQPDEPTRPIIESNNVYAIHNLICATNHAIQQWKVVLISFLSLQAEQMENLSNPSSISLAKKKKKNYQFKFDLLDTLILPITIEKIDRFQEELVRLAQCQGRLVVDAALQCLGSMLSCEVLLKPLEFFCPKVSSSNAAGKNGKTDKKDKIHHLSSSDESSTNESSSSGMAAEKEVINHQVNYVIDREMIMSFSSSTRLTICFAQFFTLLVDLANELNNPNDLPVSKIVAREHSLMQRYRPSLMRALYIVGLTGKHVTLETIKNSAERLLDNQGEIMTKYFTQERAQHKVKTLKKMINCLSTPLFNYKINLATKGKPYDPLRDQVYIVLMYFIRRALQMDPLINQGSKKRPNCDIDLDVGKKGISGLTLLTHRYHWLILESSIKQVFIDILSRRDFSKEIRVDLQIYVIDALNQYLNEYENQKYIQSQSQNSSNGKLLSDAQISCYSVGNSYNSVVNDESIKQMHDCESAHANSIAQIFHPPIINNTICVHSTSLRNSSLNFLATIFKYGLIPPSQSLSSIICLSADPDNQISTKASQLLNQIEERFPGHSVLRAMTGVRSTFQLYKNIYDGPKLTNEKSLNIIVTNGFVRGANFTNTISTEDTNSDVKKNKESSAKTSASSSSTIRSTNAQSQQSNIAISVNQIIYSVIKNNRQARRSFLANLVGLFSIESISTSNQLTIEELVFLSDQLAHLSYSTWDEVLFVNHYTEIRASLMASAFVKNFNDCLANGLQTISIQKGKNKKPEELAQKLVSLVDKADDELGAFMKKRQDKKNKNESVSWDVWPDFSDEKDSFDRPNELNLSKILLVNLESQNIPNLLNLWTTQSVIAILLIFVKSFLKAAYSITDLKQKTYSPTDNVKQWDKPAILNSPEKYSSYLSQGLIYLPKAISVCQHLAKQSAVTSPLQSSPLLSQREVRCLTRLWLIVKHLNIKTTSQSVEENSTMMITDATPSGDSSSKHLDERKKETKEEIIKQEKSLPPDVKTGKKRHRESLDNNQNYKVHEEKGAKHSYSKQKPETEPERHMKKAKNQDSVKPEKVRHPKNKTLRRKVSESEQESSSDLTPTTASSGKEDLSSLSSDNE